MDTPRTGVCLVVVLLALLGAGTAGAALNIKWYSFAHGAACDDRQRTDPVTVVFFYYAYAGWTSGHIAHHTGWGDTFWEDEQDYWRDGGCSIQDGARADGSVWSTRYHVRWEAGVYPDPAYWRFSIATPHHEAAARCGHATYPDGFNEGRAAIYNAMNGPHYTYVGYVGNSAPKTQCNGWVARSNGNVRYVQIAGTP